MPQDRPYRAWALDALQESLGKAEVMLKAMEADRIRIAKRISDMHTECAYRRILEGGDVTDGINHATKAGKFLERAVTYKESA